MRTMSLREAATYEAGTGVPCVRVEVVDAGGVARDLSSYLGRDVACGVEWSAALDTPVAEATVTVAFEVGGDESFSPLRSVRANVGAPLFGVGAEVLIYGACAAAGAAPGEEDFHLLFHGYLAKASFAATPGTLLVRDMGSVLNELQIEVDRDYGSIPGTATELVIQTVIDDNHGARFAASTAYGAVGRAAQVRPTTPNGYWYRCTTAGTSSTEPAWTTTLGATSTSGTATFRCEGHIPQLYTPTSPGSVIQTYTLKPTNVLDACRELALLDGWDCRYLYRAGTGDFALTLYQPPRAKTVADFAFPAYLFGAPSTADLDGDDIRNRVLVTWSDPGDVDATGQAKRKQVTAESVGSMRKYGHGLPATILVAEAATSQVRTLAVAQAFADAVLSDLEEPDVALTVPAPFFPWAELHDLHAFAPCSLWSATQTLAVVGYTHSLSESGHGETTLQLRGKPSAGKDVWLRREANHAAQPPSFKGPDAPPAAPPLSPVQGGLRGTIPQPTTATRPWDMHEVHLSTSSSFTPDATTLRATVGGQDFELGNLTPGTTYYVRIVPRDALGNRGNASPASSGTAAGFTAPLHLQPQVATASLPPNADFEANNTAGGPPDAHEMRVGAWGVDAMLDTFSYVYSGFAAITMPPTGVATQMQAQLCVAAPGETYYVEAHLLTPDAVHVPVVGIEWCDSADTGYNPISTSTLGLSDYTSYSPGDWNPIAGRLVAPSTARYARLFYGKASVATDFTLAVDSVLIQRDSFSTPAWVAATYGTSWSAVSGDSGGGVKYRKRADRVVEVTGAGKTSLISNTVITTLPAGYRPGNTRRWLGEDAGANGPVVIEVRTDGTIRATNTTSGQRVSLDAITFLAEA